MLSIKSINVQNNFKEWCDKIIMGETVVINEAEYNALQKAKQNAEYTDKLQRGISALNAGIGIEHELIEDFDK